MGADRDEIQAWVDGRLDGERLQRFERLLEEDAALRAEALSLRRQAEALANLGTSILDEPIPRRLIVAATGGLQPGQAPPAVGFSEPSPGTAKWRWRDPRIWLAAAAVIVLAWSAGWLSHARFSSPEATAIAPHTGPPGFVRDAVAAHVVYTPEVRHPVEVEAAQHEHLVQWLSKRLGAPLAVPALDAAGWLLVGGRLLPGSDGARAQFMYQDATGARLTLYVADAGARSDDTAFRFESEGRVSAFYWIDGRFGYTLSAETDRSTLLGLAEEVYRQLAISASGARVN